MATDPNPTSAPRPVWCPRQRREECETPNACAGGADCRLGPDPATQRTAASNPTSSLIPDIWRAIKNARDDAAAAAAGAARRRDELNDLLALMKGAGMADHLPTVDEVQAAWRGEEKSNAAE